MGSVNKCWSRQKYSLLEYLISDSFSRTIIWLQRLYVVIDIYI